MTITEWPEDLDYELALKCAKLSHTAYYDLPIGTMELEPLALLDRKCWIHICERTRALYISFRGTDSMGDMLNNLNFVQKQFGEYGKTHGGYYDYYASVRAQVLDFVRRYERRVDMVVVTGHSLGGGAAVLASVDASEVCGGGRVVCVTFGTPPIADRAFVECHHEAVPFTFRVINMEDWAPRIPTPGLFHVGRPIKLCKHEAEEEALRTKKQGVMPVPAPSHIINSHGMARYVQCLSTQCLAIPRSRLSIGSIGSVHHHRRVIR